MIPNGTQWRSDDERNSGQEDSGPVLATHGNPLGLPDLPAPSSPKPIHWLGLFAFVLLSLAMFATVVVVTAVKDKKSSLLEAEEKRLQESVSGRAKILETWLKGQHDASRRLTDSHVFRLFVTDLAQQTSLSPLPRSLQDQRPYFQQLLADFTRQNELARTAVLRTDGANLLSSPGPTLPIVEILRQTQNAEAGWNVLLSAIRRIDERDGSFVVDAIVAFPRAQEKNQERRKPEAILVLTIPIESMLGEILTNKIVDPGRERISLLQQHDGTAEEFWVDRNVLSTAADQLSDDVVPGMTVTYGRRNDGREVYSIGEPVGGAPWTVYHSLDARAALSPIHDFIKVAIVLSALTVIALTAAFSALWWRQGRNHQRRLVELYKTQAHRSERQRQFLDSVTRSMGDWLSVSSPNGELIYANPAFQAVIGHSEHSAPKQVWDDLVKELPSSGDVDHDLVSLIDADGIDVVEIGTVRYHVSPTVSDLKTDDGSIQGTLRVFRDQTELTSERRRRLRTMAQTIDAFVHAIELRDPFLVGHSDRVRTHAIAIGKTLGLPRDDLASLALAASLSQIGKIFIPDDILGKPDRHSPEEGDIMRDHILHAVDILRKVDFDLPIVDIVAQMHERQDGSGYPHRLSGDQIGLGGRILGIADVFCARTAPRSYRDRLSAGKTLYHLASNERRYDLKVVAALADIVDHGPEAHGLDAIERTFVDAGIWQKKRMRHDQARESA